MDNINNTQGFSFDLPKGNSSIIKVIGVGGGGNNALKHMYEKGIYGVDFVICNTDAQTLDNNPVANKVQLGVTMTEGLGAGADPEVGEKAAIESIDDIKASMGQNTKMVFITAGMGGGTGTGAAPVIAKVAKEMGILTVGIVTVPFSFEGKRRLDQANLGLEKLRNNVDSLIVINNDKLRQQFGNLGFKQGFSKADEVLTNAAKGMAEVITGYFDVNIDFRDAKSVLANSGTALMSTGVATGEKKAEEAVKKALDSPLLNDNKITGAKNVLLLIRSGVSEVTMDEIGVIMDHIQKEAGNTADIIFGVGTDEELGDAVSVLVIATGFSNEDKKHSGVTETIKYTLEDRPTPSSRHRESPFKSRAQEERQQPESRKNFFRLEDDDDFRTSNFPTNSLGESLVEEVKTETQIIENEEIQDFSNDYRPNEKQEYNLFNFDEDDSYDLDLEPQSFTFEVEDKPKASFKEEEIEKPVEVTFTINETAFEEEFPVIEKQVVSEIKTELTDETQTEEIKKTENPTAFSFTSEVKEEIVEQKLEEPVQETESGFTFFNKTSDSSKAMERRNKLKEFNSRYQQFDNENVFETVPAFKRKNINIDGSNASDQHINTYLSDNNGSMQLRENRFLNKDVD
ncbi:cell division protein FtsZ [Epilithonimonas hominis]|uniref:Cell division protein FtsZ n=1 Tax=Epilithonimonas hominis TaxID=420404 RepID=A0A1H6I209_9FLAO|nr:cell division protein FtsZ [Epilithonimonas hominis]SEH41500.1 cell division protein FtsZ [Epilithonimonas hominis]HAP94176.1 cell division protein FtsZ [Chryseobacterium sp.]